MKKQTGILLLVGLAIVIGLIYWTSSKDSTKLGAGVFMSGPVKFKYLGQGPEGVAAKLVNKSITEKELIKRSSKLQELEKSEIKILQNKNNLNQVKLSEIKTQQFQEKIIVLRGLFVRQLLLLDAKAKKATIESLVKGHIVKGSIVVSDREIELFAKDKNITLRPNDHRLNKQLKSIITENKRNMAINNYIKKTFPDKYAEIFFRGPTKIIPINENKSISSRRKEGELTPTIYVFSNLLCAPCKKLSKEIQNIHKKHSDEIRISYFNLFSQTDWRSQLIGEATFCLNQQSPKYFWDFMERMSVGDEFPNEESIRTAARGSGADYDNFNSCLLGHKFREDLDRQAKYISDLGITSMPTVIIGGAVYTGNISREELFNAISFELEVEL